MTIKVKHQSKVSKGIVKTVEVMLFDNLGARVVNKRRVIFL